LNVPIPILNVVSVPDSSYEQYSRLFRRAREESGTETILNVCNMERSLVGRKHVYTL